VFEPSLDVMVNDGSDCLPPGLDGLVRILAIVFERILSGPYHRLRICKILPMPTI
jgi:hypothetical protein